MDTKNAFHFAAISLLLAARPIEAVDVRRRLFLLGPLLFIAVIVIAWKFMDGEARPVWRTHIEAFLSGAIFSVGIETVQFFLPTRAADVNDVFWNTLGTLVGCVAAHVGRSITIEWG